MAFMQQCCEIVGSGRRDFEGRFRVRGLVACYCCRACGCGGIGVVVSDRFAFGDGVLVSLVWVAVLSTIRLDLESW
jgi:hypothetical protein